MRNILAGAHREALERFFGPNVLVAFDFDGTLAPLVPDPAHATMRRRTHDLLRELARLCRVVVISGRARADAAEKLRGIGVVEVLGNHGIEPWHAAHWQFAEVRRWLPLLEERASSLPGVTIEDKNFSVAIHYRRSPEKRRARAAILKTAATLGEVRAVGGKQVVNLLPSGAPHKGTALERERDRAGCDRAIYVGDDETDEDVFALDQPERLLTVRVGSKRGSAAAYCIPGQRAIDEFLRLLIDLRLRAEPRGRAAR